MRFVVIYIRKVRTQTGTSVLVSCKRKNLGNVWKPIRTHASLSSSRSNVNTVPPNKSSFYKINSMLPCVCSEIARRIRRNEVRTF